MPRAPSYWPPIAAAGSDFRPMLPSNPARSERWIVAYRAASMFAGNVDSMVQPASASTAISCACTSRHSVMRRKETKCARHASTRLRCDSAFCAGLSKNSHNAISDRKSERSSRNCRCAWSAACARSSGRSRGSGTDSALAMTRPSARQPFSRAASTIRPMRGSSGSFASSRPARRQPAIRVHGFQFLQQLVTVRDRARGRRVEERKRGDIAQRERGHPQYHRRERAAQDLRVGVLGPRGEIGFVEKAHADAVLHAAATSGALVRRRLRDLLDLQQRRLVAHRIALDAREPAVDHIADPRDRQRRFGDVGGEHDAPAARRREHALLLVDGEPRVERQYLDRARIRTPRERASQHVRRFADLALAGQEHEDVARPFAPQVLRRAGDRLLEFFFVVRFGVSRTERPIADRDRPGAARHGDDRRGTARRCEVSGKALGIDRRRRDDEFQVPPPNEQVLQITEQEIDVETALVRLVDDDRVVAGEIADRPASRRAGCHRSSA